MSRVHHPRAAALVGIGCRLPAGQGPDLAGPAALWEHVRTGTNAITRYPERRWQAMQDRLHPDDRGAQPWPLAHITAPDTVDPAAFDLRPGEAAVLSATQRLVLQVGAEALADAGIAPAQLAGPTTGIYVGNASPDEALRTFAPGARPRLDQLSAGGAGMIATPLSRWLDARGPLATVDTSCSSTGYALDVAVQALATGRVETAIVIGANTAADPVVGRTFADGPVLASDGIGRPFDAHASGFVRGEGVIVLVLRGYRAARTRRDRIYTVIEAVEVGSDGRSAGVGMPSSRAQEELIRRAYTAADVDPLTVDWVLAHGTGTVGDIHEAKALGRVFERADNDALWVGSVKGGLGHGEGAAALTSVAVAALALYHGQIPPTVGHTDPHTVLDRHGLRVPTRALHWPDRAGAPRGRTIAAPRRAAVTALGFSGATVHAILTEARRNRRPLPAHPDTSGAVVVPLSGRSGAHLAAQADRLGSALAAQPRRPRLAQVASWAALRGPDPRAARAAVFADRPAQVRGAVQALARGRTHPHLVLAAPSDTSPAQVWVFGGHGAAAPQMGRELYQHDALFRDYVDEVCEVLDLQPGSAGWRPLTDPAPAGLATVQQATFAMQVATARLLRSRWGMVPDAVIGHSLGEVAAAHISGALTLPDAAHLVCARSTLLERIVGRGGMVAASVDAATAADLAELFEVTVAATNAPARTVFSGPDEQLKALMAHLEARGITARHLDGAPPAHSPAVDGLLDELASALRGMRPRTGQVEMVSTVTGAPVPGHTLDAPYWVDQLRSPVRLHEAIVRLGARGPALALEVSPHPTLTVPITETRARHHLDLTVLPLAHPDGERLGLARAAATAYTRGLPLTWPYAYDTPLDVPPTPWEEGPAPAHRPLAEQLDGLRGAPRARAVVEIVHRAVADLAPVQVRAADHDRGLDQLGCNSMDLLALRTSLLGLLERPPADLPEHAPTINGIARALTRLAPEPD